MSLPWTFANFTTGNHPASTLDDNFQAVAVNTIMPCTATGTNAITLTPLANTPALPAYQNYVVFSFFAAGASTGNVTIRVGTLPILNAYHPDGVTRAGAGELVANTLYRATYSSSLNSGAGGFIVEGGVASEVVPVLITAFGAIAGDATKADANALAILAAFNAYPAVRVPLGTFYTSNVIIPTTARWLGGEGTLASGGTLLGAGQGLMDVVSNTAGFTIDGLTIQAPSGSGTTPAIRIASCTGATVRNCKGLTGQYAVLITGSTSTIIEDNTVTAYLTRGIYAATSCSKTKISRNDVSGGGGSSNHGITCETGTDFTVTENTVLTAKFFGINFAGAAGGTALSELVCADNIVRNSIHEGINFQNVTNGSVTGNDLSFDATSVDYAMAFFSDVGETTTDIVVAGNKIREPGKSAIALSATGTGVTFRIDISANYIRSPNALNLDAQGSAVLLQGSNVQAIAVYGNFIVDNAVHMLWQVLEFNGGLGNPNSNFIGPNYGTKGTSGYNSILGAATIEGQTTKLNFFGGTSGQITVQPQAAAGTYNFNLPTTAGSAGQPMLSGGGAAAAMTWGSVSGTGNFALTDSPVFTTQITDPLVIGGSAVGSSLTLESTLAAGTTDSIIFKSGSQATRATIAGGTGLGKISFGPRAPNTAFVDINQNAANTASAVANPILRLADVDGTNTAFEMASFGAATANAISGAIAGGTMASPTATPISKGFFSLGGYGYNGSAYSAGAFIQMITKEAWGASAQGSGIDFYVTANTTTTLSRRMILNASGGLGLNTTTDPGAGMLVTNSATFMIRTATAYANGAGVGAGTITNAPAAGNPTKWIPVDDNGTTRYVPSW